MSDETPESDSAEPESAALDPAITEIMSAIEGRDAGQLCQLIVNRQFVLISVTDEDEDDDEAMGAITAEVDGYDVLVAFTSESLAGEFVDAMSEMFAEEDQIQGFIVDGDALLDYLPDNYGLLFNPETENTALVESDLARQVIASSGAD